MFTRKDLNEFNLPLTTSFFSFPLKVNVLQNTNINYRMKHTIVSVLTVLCSNYSTF